MKTRWIISVAMVAVLALALSGAGPQSAEKIFRSGLYEEQVGGNLQKAIAIYEDLLKRFPDSRDVAAKAQLHIGLCYEKLGTTEAEKAFRKVIENYPEQSAAVREAREKLASLPQARGGIKTGAALPATRQVWAGAGVDTMGGISPDGRYLSFVDWDTGDLALRDLAAGTNRRLTNKGTWQQSSEFAMYSVWSRDGRRIAYQWYGKDDILEIRVYDAQDSSVRTIVRDKSSGDWAQAFDWSADGATVLVAFWETATPDQKERGRVGLVSLKDGSVKWLKGHFETLSVYNFGWGFSFSPDGRSVVYGAPRSIEESGNDDIFLISLDDETEERVVDHPGFDKVVGWTPDGRGLLFSSDRAGSQDLYLLPLSNGKPQGSPQLVKSGLGTITPLGITPRGNLYYGLGGGGTDIYVADIGGRTGDGPVPVKKLALPYEGRNMFPDFSPDGDRIAFLSTPPGRGEILGIVSRKTGRVREFRPGLPRFLAPRWIPPDGRYVGVQGRDKEGLAVIYRVDVETGESSAVFSLDKGWFFYGLPVWAPDGQQVYYACAAGSEKTRWLYAYDLRTGQREKLVGSPLEPFALSISTDGKWLAIINDQGRRSLRVLPTSGGEPREIHSYEQAGGPTVTPAWSVDGRSIYIPKLRDAEKGTCDLYRVPIDGGAIEAIKLGLVRVGFLSVNPKGQEIAFQSLGSGPRPSEVWVLENFLTPAPAVPERAAAGPNILQIWSGPDAGRAGRVSPDGKRLTLIDDVTGNLCVRDLATGKITNVTNRSASENRFEFAGLSCWSPDGTTLAYGWLNGGAAMDVRIIGVDGSHGRILYQKPGEFAVPMAWSPDGKLVAIELLRDSYTSFGVGVLSLEDGSLRVLKESKLLKTVPKNIVFSGDGRSVLVDLPQAADDPKHDIFAFPIDGRPETRVVEHAANDAVLEWIPGSDALLFASDRAGTLDAGTVEIGGGMPRGEPRLVRKNLGDIMSLGFSRDGAYFYRLPVDMEDIAVASIDIEKGSLLEAPKVLPQDVVGVSYSPQWSPDGKWLAYISTRREALGGRTSGILRIRSTETGQIRDVPMKIARFGRATWAPDGRSLFILASDEKIGQSLLRVDVQTGATAVLVASGRPDVSMTSIAPASDGRTVYYTVFEFGKKHSRIMALDLSTRESREIHQQEAPLNLAGLSLSQDGKRLMFGAAEPDMSWVLRAIDLPDGPPREIVRAKTSAISASVHGSYCWTPAGDGILFFKGDPEGKKKTWELCYAPAGGGEIRSVGLVIDGAPISLSLHPDGHRLAIAITREGGEVWAMENFLPPGKK